MFDRVFGGPSRVVARRSSTPRFCSLALLASLRCAALLCAALAAPAAAAQGVPSVQFAVADSSASEGAGAASIEVRLSSVATTNVSVPIVLSGSATAGIDYALTTNPVIVPAGATTANALLTIAQDTLYEGDETAVLTMGPPTGATLGALTVHTFRILEDDPPPRVGFTVHRQVAHEAFGAFVVRLQLDRLSGVEARVPLVFSGPASGPSDITPPQGPVVIPPGQLFRDVSIGLVVDRVGEAGEFVTIRMGTLVGATPGAIDTLHVAIDDGAAAPALLAPALNASPPVLTFPQTSVGNSAGIRQLLLTNYHSAPIPFLGLTPASGAVAGYIIRYPGYTLPRILAPGQSTVVDVELVPMTPGPRVARFSVQQGLGGVPPREVTFQGRVLGPPGAEVVMNAGETSYTMPDRTFWSADYGPSASDGYLVSVLDVLGTQDDTLYHSSQWGQLITYEFQVPNGLYEFGFRAWEPVHTAAGSRVFDVRLEGQLVFDDLDLVALAGPRTAWVSPRQAVQVTDGVLDIRFEASVARALVSALEVRSVPILSTPASALNFGTVDQGHFGQLDLELLNTGLATARAVSIQLVPGSSGPANEFAVQAGSHLLVGSSITATLAVDLSVLPGQTVRLPVIFTPTQHRDNDVLVRVNFANSSSVEVIVRGTGGANAGWGFLHPVIDRDPLVVIDYDGNGSEVVQFSAADSHTHEPGRSLAGYEWRLGGQVLGTTIELPVTLPLGQSFVALTITDDSTPPAAATDTRPVSVNPASAVPGLLCSYYDGSVAGEVYLLDHVPQSANFVARQAALRTDQSGVRVGSSPFTAEVMVRWQAQFGLPGPLALQFVAAGGDGRRVFVDGQLVTGPLSLAAGSHSLDVRFAVSDVADLPLTLTVSAGGQSIPGFEGRLTHGEGQLAPIIHSMPTQGIDVGGNDIVIDGFGFFPRSAVVVNWGSTTIPSSQFVASTAERIQFVSPPGTGNVDVRVTTPNGTSNSVTFHYSPSGPVPIRWNVLEDRKVSFNGATRAAWGPDGRLWVALLDGSLRAIRYDENWYTTSVQYYAGLVGRANKDILGLTFNPFDRYDPQTPSSLVVYVAHGDLYQNGGGAFTGPSAFTGEVSILRGPSFDAPTPLLSGLPVSNHDHSLNGLEFDDNGDLLLACGGNTNAGVTSPAMGAVPESYFSAAILKAHTSRPGFVGNVVHLDRNTGQAVLDQRFGETTIPDPTSQVEVFAAGLRNPFDLILHSNGNIYATDNGPNMFFGAASTSLTTDTGTFDRDRPDEVLLIERGNYYGHPNRARALDDARQAVYRDEAAPSVPHEFTRALAYTDSSVDGLHEYRATAFNSQLRGDLLTMKWTGASGIRRFQLAPGGRSFVAGTGLPFMDQSRGLDLATAPGGAIIVVDHPNGDVRAQVPNDVTAIGLTPYDVFPARAPNLGGVPFELGGVGFGALGSTTVTFDGAPAVLTSVTSKRIKGVVPASPTGRVGAVDVVVNTAGSSATIPQGFRYLPAQPGQASGFWTSAAPLPFALAEVAAGEVSGMLYVFGQGDARTLRYDLLNDTWSANLAQRPFAGNHHACEVWAGKVYLFGGLDGGSPGRVQIYDPTTDTWALGAPMPWAGGSVASALIGGRVIVAGGIVGASTVANCAAYDLALDTWSPRAALPLGVNHAASATDGARLYVFGGRQGANVAQPGFSNVQIYDPATDQWSTSQAGQVVPMPLPRGGTGRAVWYRGEFYVFGGESASAVFGDVQAFNPVTSAWRRDAPLPTPRHGIFPFVFQDRVFVFGGGASAGFSLSAAHEVFKRP